jgi:GNAT superfamily N-acetyltransferase
MGIRRARPGDGTWIAAVHVTCWRSAYPGLLPAEYLAALSIAREGVQYERAIAAKAGVFVAEVGNPAHIVGFSTSGRARRQGMADGEIETLYVLDDFREKGAGRGLLARAAAHLAGLGLTSVMVWVLRDNPSRWFYSHLGGVPVAEETTTLAGVKLVQIAYRWADGTALMQL